MGQPYRVGIIGLGVISRAYLDTFARCSDIAVAVVADLDHSRAEATAATIPGSRAATVEDLLASRDLDVVLNLTVPVAHAEVSLQAVDHGKPVYGEKPLAITLEDGRRVITAARAGGVWVGSAPDTVLGTGVQTARAAIETGTVGTPTSAQATFVSEGPEGWHPNPFFYYQPGGGPMLDMGPYYISALIHLLGPVASVTGMSARPRAERTSAAGPRAGETFPVTVETLVAAVLRHESGAISTLTTSFEGRTTAAPPIEVQGTGGTLAVPDPNMFDGVVTAHLPGSDGPTELAPSAGYAESQRGIGVIDFLRRGPEQARAHGELALHVLDVMESCHVAARERREIDLTTTVVRPATVPFTPATEWTRA